MDGEDREIDELMRRKMLELYNEYRRWKEFRERVSDMGYIYEVSDRDFDEKVLEMSRFKPVIVDFWAPWCGPCVILSPTIESAVKRFRGEVLLAKLNVDENPITASKYNIMSIPTVILFRDGKPVDYFIGFRPEEFIVEFIKRNIS